MHAQMNLVFSWSMSPTQLCFKETIKQKGDFEKESKTYRVAITSALGRDSN